jgi:hypothetical protein
MHLKKENYKIDFYNIHTDEAEYIISNVGKKIGKQNEREKNTEE